MFNLVMLFIVIAGAINWFIIGVFQFDVIAGIFGSQSVFMSRFFYTLIGFASFWILLLLLIKKGKLDFSKNKNIKNKFKNLDAQNPNQTNNKDINQTNQDSENNMYKNNTENGINNDLDIREESNKQDMKEENNNMADDNTSGDINKNKDIIFVQV